MAAASGSQATRLHHMGMTVSDLDRSVAFYGDVFGLPLDGEFAVPAEFALQVSRVNAACRGAFLKVGDAVLELLEYRDADGRPYELGNGDVGAAHPCFEVEDLDAAYARLQALGADCFTEPLPIDEGDLAGYRWLYFKDPDGIVVELFQPPSDEGRA